LITFRILPLRASVMCGSFRGWLLSAGSGAIAARRGIAFADQQKGKKLVAAGLKARPGSTLSRPCRVSRRVRLCSRPHGWHAQFSTGADGMTLLRV
jgi:hypothetical protein